MKKIILIFSVFAFFLLLTGCNKPDTAEAALKEAGMEAESIYLTENYDNVEVMFYKDNETKHPYASIFNVEDDGSRSFITYVDFYDMNASDNEKITVGASYGQKSMNQPDFMLQYGVINDTQIEKVKLYMFGNSKYDRYAETINMDGIRVWYTFLDVNNLFFNIHEGISENGDIVYTNDPAFSNIINKGL